MNLSILPKAPSLAGRSVFLSASFPHPGRNRERYYDTSDASEIAQAVVALSRAVFRAKGRLVFGGHPTISPLVMMVAEEYMKPALTERQVAARPEVRPVLIFQSKVFGGKVSEPISRLLDLRLGELVLTEPAPGEKAEFNPDGSLDPASVRKSLVLMRRQMLDPAGVNPVAAVFIGGMEGIRDEIELFQTTPVARRTYCVGAPGGAARELALEQASQTVAGPGGLTGHDLATLRQYPALMQRIILNVCGAL